MVLLSVALIVLGLVIYIFTSGDSAPYYEETNFDQFEKGRANFMVMA